MPDSKAPVEWVKITIALLVGFGGSIAYVHSQFVAKDAHGSHVESGTGLTKDGMEKYVAAEIKKHFDEESHSDPPAAFHGCPGDVLDGEHTPRGGHAKWFWNLDMSTGIAKIEKSPASVSGRVEMSCSRGKWNASLSEMTHGVTYNCRASVESDRLVNGTCTSSEGGIIDVTGKFSRSISHGEF